ncbi:MAG: FecR domain-containing protein [Candidatus Eremiobacteraeota bacterium]|nr:FecR domain-containing protein [Candidatus Eremiobacteraeota bacterium]
MTSKSVISVISAVVLVGVILATALRAPVQRAPEKVGAPDRSGPGVVRVSIVEGSAIVQRGDSRVQSNAVRNAPLLPGDYISTGKLSRAELQFDGFTAVRLGGNVQARVISGDADNRKLQLAEGTVEVGMVRDGQPLQVDTPSVSVRTRQAGDVRVSIAGDGSSWITARRGSADVVTPQGTQTIGTGKTMIAAGSASHPSITNGPEVAFDSFDDFNVQRDATMVAALNASPNLSPRLAGYDNLNDYGKWQAVAGYGQSWVPNEPSGWVPYRNGSWSWEGGYGWTWIGSEPWGWAPYHYGNWYYCSCGASGWAWLPPSHGASPAWSPALVGFFGFDVAQTGGYNNCGGNYAYGQGGGGPEAPYNAAPAASYGNAPAPASYNNAPPQAPYNAATPAPYGEGGGTPYENPPPAAAPYGEGGPGPGYAPAQGYPYPYIGWVPIAPYEPYYPWYPGWAWLGFGWGFPFFGGYGYPGAFATNIVRVTNIYNINRIYRNFRHGGASGTSLRNFRHGTLVGHTLPVTGREIGHRFGTIHGALPVTPTRDNLGFSRGTLHTPVTFSKLFKSARFGSDRALSAPTTFARQRSAVAQAIHDGLTGRVAHAAPAHAVAAHGPAHSTVGHVSAPVSRANAREARASAPTTRAHVAQARSNAPVSRAETPAMRNRAAMRQQGISHQEGMSRQMEAPRHDYAPARREVAAPATRANAAQTMRGERSATMHENAPAMHENAPAMRENAPAMREAPRTESAPATSWDRFNQARGSSERANSPMQTRGEMSAPGEAAREQRAAPTDSWGRFSESRGESYGNARSPYEQRDAMPSSGREMPSYSREQNAFPYSRESAPSYSRGSYPSYSRGPYESYPRGSYPSYARPSNPGYSRGSYPSYSRGSYPSNPRGSYGSGPSYPRGNSAPPRSSGGGGGGGGGDHHGGGHRPPNNN